MARNPHFDTLSTGPRCRLTEVSLPVPVSSHADCREPPRCLRPPPADTRCPPRTGRTPRSRSAAAWRPAGHRRCLQPAPAGNTSQIRANVQEQHTLLPTAVFARLCPRHRWDTWRKFRLTIHGLANYTV